MTCRRNTCLLLAAAGLGLALGGCASMPCCSDHRPDVVILVPVPGPRPHPHPVPDPQPAPPIAEAPPARYEPAAPVADTATATKTRERPADTSRGTQRADGERGTSGRTRSR